MSIDKKAILEQILVEHPKLEAETEKRLQNTINGFSSYDYTFYLIVRHHHADQSEEKFGLLEKVLNHIKLNNPENYMEALKLAFRQVKDYCISNRENKIAPFLTTLMGQIKNVDPVLRNEYFNEIKKIFMECYLCVNTPAKELDESRQYSQKSDGDLSFYDARNKWPLHVIVESVKNIFPALTSFLVSEFRKNADLSCNTIEQIVTEAITPWLSAASTHYLLRIGKTPQDIINDLLEEWDAQFTKHQVLCADVFEYFEPNAIPSAAPYLTPITLDFLGVPTDISFLTQFQAAAATVDEASLTKESECPLSVIISVTKAKGAKL